MTYNRLKKQVLHAFNFLKTDSLPSWEEVTRHIFHVHSAYHITRVIQCVDSLKRNNEWPYYGIIMRNTSIPVPRHCNSDYIPTENIETIKRIFIRSINEKRVKVNYWKVIDEWIELKINSYKQDKIKYIKVSSIEKEWIEEFLFDSNIKR